MIFEKSLKIDYDTIKALSVKKRLEILELLSKKSLTLSEIAEKLNISAATAKEHLDILAKVGLIEKEDTDRKWKYYSLSPKAESLLFKTQANVVFALFASLIVLITSFISYLISILKKNAQTLAEKNVMFWSGELEPKVNAMKAANDSIVVNQTQNLLSLSNVLLTIFLVSLAFVIILLIYLRRQKNKSKK